MRISDSVSLLIQQRIKCFLSENRGKKFTSRQICDRLNAQHMRGVYRGISSMELGKRLGFWCNMEDGLLHDVMIERRGNESALYYMEE